MEFYLNREQSKGLANFFFDMAKGVLLGSFGFVTVAEAKIVIILIGVFVAAICIVQALSLLGKLE